MDVPDMALTSDAECMSGNLYLAQAPRSSASDQHAKYRTPVAAVQL